MWRVVGVRMGMPRHDMEVEGVVVKDDAVNFLEAGNLQPGSVLLPVAFEIIVVGHH